MTQEEKHVELLKAAYQKWHDSKADSVDYWLGLMTDDIKFRSLGAGTLDVQIGRSICIFVGEVVVAITKVKLDFGPWDQIFYGEFDGRRRKRVLVKIIGE